jgi:hypothetical protein
MLLVISLSSVSQLTIINNMGFNTFYQDLSYDLPTDLTKVEEQDPLNYQFVNNAINVDTTNVSATTHYYPDSSGYLIDDYKDFSLSGQLVDADGTLTLSVEVTNDEDAATANWIQVYGYDDESDTNVNSITVTNGTITPALSFNEINFRYLRIVLIASGATNTVILKGRLKAL